MARTTNILIRGTSGALGKEVVFKTRKNGDTFVTKYPAAPRFKSSKKQAKGRNKFAEAVKFARYTMNNPSGNKALKVKKHGSLYHASIAAFMKGDRSLAEFLADPAFDHDHRAGHSKRGRQEKAIRWTRKKGSINNSDYQRLTDTSKATATRDLQDLVKRKILQSSGTPGAGAYYTLIGSSEK